MSLHRDCVLVFVANSASVVAATNLLANNISEFILEKQFVPAISLCPHNANMN